jgi:formylglycine-generating enzyme
MATSDSNDGCESNRQKVVSYGVIDNQSAKIDPSTVKGLTTEKRIEQFADEWPFYKHWADNMLHALDGQVSKMVANTLIPGASSGAPPAIIKNEQSEKQTLKADRYTETVNGVSFEMVKIPAGKFMMGSPTTEDERTDNETLHEVTLSKPFYIGVHTVTFDLYDQYVLETKHNRPGDRGWGRDKQPVINVSWEDTAGFCIWLSKKTGKKYRLPTEAEWEYACRAGTETPFNTGYNVTTQQANYNGEYPYKGNSKGENRAQTLPVGSFAPNNWGLFDMHGNVWEWCNDRFGSYPTKSVLDPEGPKTGSDRVVRGGSWNNRARYCRSAGRNYGTASGSGSHIGFRLASQ